MNAAASSPPPTSNGSLEQQQQQPLSDFSDSEFDANNNPSLRSSKFMTTAAVATTTTTTTPGCSELDTAAAAVVNRNSTPSSPHSSPASSSPSSPSLKSAYLAALTTNANGIDLSSQKNLAEFLLLQQQHMRSTNVGISSGSNSSASSTKCGRGNVREEEDVEDVPVGNSKRGDRRGELEDDNDEDNENEGNEEEDDDEYISSEMSGACNLNGMNNYMSLPLSLQTNGSSNQHNDYDSFNDFGKSSLFKY
jgi:hypothetical protein